MNDVPVVIQAGRTDCGIAALVMLARSFGIDCSVASLRRQFGQHVGQPSLQSILDLAGLIGLSVRAVRMDLVEIEKLSVPAILHWELDHFVVLVRRRGNRFTINDPVCGRRELLRSDFSNGFTGIAVLVDKSHTLTGAATESYSMTQVVRAMFSEWRMPITAILLLMVCSQVLAIAPSVGLQMLVDNLMAAKDTIFIRTFIRVIV